MPIRSDSRGFGITPSVLDRLVDEEPRLSTEAAGLQHYDLDELKKAIRRDVEWLLNTRMMLTEPLGELAELKKSVVTYGIPDITGVNIENKSAGIELRSAVEEAIRIFEPRFLDVKVSMEPMSSTDRQLRFRIEARLDLDPVPEPMVFDTVLQLGSGAIAVTDPMSRDD